MAYVDDDEQKEFVDKEFSAREVDRMREAINDPSLSVEDRKNLLYALSNAGRLRDEEIDYYAEQVGADADDVREGGEAVHENMANARKSLDRAVSRDSAVADAYNSLGAGGFATSDEMIDQLESVIGMFETYYPLYEQATQYVSVPVVPSTTEGAPESSGSIFGDRGEGGGGKAKYTHSGIDPESLRSGLQEFRGIDFGAFRADSEMLRQAHQAVSGHADALESSWKDNTDDWTGDAKDAAGQVNQGLSKAAETLVDGLATAADDLAAAADGLEKFVADFGEDILRVYHNGEILLPPNDVDAQIECMELLPDAKSWANDEFEWGDYEYMLPRQGRLIEHFWKSDFLEECDTLLEAAEEKLKAFCEEYRARAERFHGEASRYVQMIDSGYAEMIQTIGSHIEPNPFEAMDVGNGDNGAPKTPTGPSGVPSGPGGTGGGLSGGGGGGGMPPGGGGGIPSADDLKPEDGVGTNPVTNKPLEINPETGEPYPIDPVTGEPIKDADGSGKLTVEQGDQKFTMTEPGEDGAMGISVENESGDLSEYKLDFGDAEGEDSEAADDGEGRDGLGPQGSDSAADKVYRPGPDGKIHIEDGDLKITAERPDGPDGPTVVTVENGDGEPVTYTLGDEEPSVGDEGISTQPAEADPAQHPRNMAGARETPQPPSGAGGGAPSPGDAGIGAGSHHEPTNGGGTAATGAEAPAASVSSGDGVGGGSNESSAAGQDSSATHAAAAVGGGGGSAFGGGGGGELLSDEGQEHRGQSSSPSGAGLGAAPGGEAPAAMPQGGAASGSSAGGMGMMGGMGAMGGGGGGQGDDQERTSSAYRIDGNIFDLPFEAVRISGSLEGAPDVPVRFSR
ncbi:WXG100 family type VII secretion target [Saccharomonospora azurea]|uniref:WXG100 family type VII secretion target n=1 Tax=Saccharomonospora azurea TaxID=40988 RepID=UPI0024094837|nr:WXG100 family type VII secretion target [Saccharomonospora azurea]